jgi:hypothetical protein
MAKNITGEINFYSHTTDGSPPMMDPTPTSGWVATNYVLIPTRVTIHDLRGKENTVDLDTNGFEIRKYDGHIHDVYNDHGEMQRCYDEEIVTVLKKRLGASRVIVFNHIMRDRGPPRAADQCDPTHKNPVFYPHVDNDPPGVPYKVKEVLGEEEAEKVMQKRFQIINVWRPLGPNPITNTPLTLCDYRTLDVGNDLHVSEVRNSVATTSLYMISHNSKDAQRWYYLSEMKSDEMIILKIYDSNPDVAQFGAHTAFINESVPSMDIEQHSIEMRCLVFYD